CDDWAEPSPAFLKFEEKITPRHIKMRASILFVLLLSAVLVQDTDAWKFWNKVKSSVSKASKWIKNNCSVGFPPSISCKLNGRRKRQAETGVTDETLQALANACPAFNIGDNAPLPEVIKDCIEAADNDGDGDLTTEEETAMFVDLV
ncbi:hypothetical protein BaRGS_00032069, partial [Batillaria attramentaria]